MVASCRLPVAIPPARIFRWRDSARGQVRETKGRGGYPKSESVGLSGGSNAAGACFPRSQASPGCPGTRGIEALGLVAPRRARPFWCSVARGRSSGRTASAGNSRQPRGRSYGFRAADARRLSSIQPRHLGCARGGQCTEWYQTPFRRGAHGSSLEQLQKGDVSKGLRMVCRGELPRLDLVHSRPTDRLCAVAAVACLLQFQPRLPVHQRRGTV